MAESATGWRPRDAVELIVGTPPGGGQDRPARAMMRVLEAEGLVGAPMRLVNLPGRGGANAWEALRQRAGDPHVLSTSSGPLVTNRILGVCDFDHAALTPIATLYTEYLVFVARAGAALDSGAGLLARLGADPAQVPVAIATARGNANHIALGQIARHAGCDPKRIRVRVFESALDAVADVAEGRAAAGVVSTYSAARALETGVLRALAVTAPERLGGVFASVPTWRELAVLCTTGQWRGLLAAPGISPEAVAFWERAFAAAAGSAAWAAELERHFWIRTWMGSEETRVFLDAERAFLGGMLRELGLAAA